MLEALAEGPRPLTALRREAGSPPQTTMRGHLRTLTETGVVERRRQNEFPGSLDLELTPVGQELWEIAKTLRAWLAISPEGPLELGSSSAKSAIKALVEGWGTNMIRALAARPLSLTELNGLISSLSYPSLERRLGAMRLAGQIKRMPEPGRGTPYAVTNWLRYAVAPLGAATRWERLHAPGQTTPARRLDVEAAFLLTIPLLRLSTEMTGVCRLVVELGGSNGDGLAGVLVGVREGQVVSCVATIRGQADAWASGSSSTWLGVVIEQDIDRLEIGGNHQLARALIDSLHSALFGALRRS
jgi:DNA-binding HxlR family transcriptional regulator